MNPLLCGLFFLIRLLSLKFSFDLMALKTERRVKRLRSDGLIFNEFSAGLEMSSSCSSVFFMTSVPREMWQFQPVSRPSISAKVRLMCSFSELKWMKRMQHFSSFSTSLMTSVLALYCIETRPRNICPECRLRMFSIWLCFLPVSLSLSCECVLGESAS